MFKSCMIKYKLPYIARQFFKNLKSSSTQKPPKDSLNLSRARTMDSTTINAPDIKLLVLAFAIPSSNAV